MMKLFLTLILIFGGWKNLMSQRTNIGFRMPIVAPHLDYKSGQEDRQALRLKRKMTSTSAEVKMSLLYDRHYHEDGRRDSIYSKNWKRSKDYAYYNYRYDEKKRLIRIDRFVSLKGEMVPAVLEYDSLNRIVKRNIGSSELIFTYCGPSDFVRSISYSGTTKTFLYTHDSLMYGYVVGTDTTIELTYNENEKVILEERDRYRFVYTYDERGNRLTSTLFEPRKGTWRVLEKCSYSYNEENRCSEEICQSTIGEKFIHYKYRYLENGLTDVVEQLTKQGRRKSVAIPTNTINSTPSRSLANNTQVSMTQVHSRTLSPETVFEVQASPCQI